MVSKAHSPAQEEAWRAKLRVARALRRVAKEASRRKERRKETKKEGTAASGKHNQNRNCTPHHLTPALSTKEAEPEPQRTRSVPNGGVGGAGLSQGTGTWHTAMASETKRDPTESFQPDSRCEHKAHIGI